MGNDRNSNFILCVGGYESNAFLLIIMMWSVYQISITSNFAYFLAVSFTVQTNLPITILEYSGIEKLPDPVCFVILKHLFCNSKKMIYSPNFICILGPAILRGNSEEK